MSFSRARQAQQPFLRLLAAATVSAILMSTSFSAQATVATGTMGAARMLHQANALPDGRILVSGGYAKPGGAPYASTEIYDPASGVFTPAAPMLQARTNHAAVTLADGRVLVMGGSIVTSPGLVGTATAELYDPATGQWTATGNMTVARWRAMARRLPDGKVFVMNQDRTNSYAEVYDPQTGVFTKTGNVLEPTSRHGLTVLLDGRVLKVGGYASQYVRTAEIWDPATNRWNWSGAMKEARESIHPVVLPDGRVLVAGGGNDSTLNSAEIYDPATALFTSAGVMPQAMNVDAGVTLSDGSVLLSGPMPNKLVRYQPGPGTWNLTGPKPSALHFHASLNRLPDGGLLLAGGAANNDAMASATVWDLACAPQAITVANPGQSVAGNGGVVSWLVSAAPGCRFEVADLPSWLVPYNGTVKQMEPAGTMPFKLRAMANTSGATRSATLMLGNSRVTVTQAP